MPPELLSIHSRRVRLLIFHGYLLRGTGSNVYNAELAEALVRSGHDVHLLCQEQRPGGARLRRRGRRLGRRAAEVRAGAAAGRTRGRCTVYRPDIGGLLPVYVYDDYEGFEVKTFDRLTDDELDRYIDANVAAVRDVAEAGRASRPASPTTC